MSNGRSRSLGAELTTSRIDPPKGPSFSSLVAQQQQLLRDKSQVDATQARDRAMPQAGGFLPLPAINLAGTDIGTGGLALHIQGTALVFEQVGSTPGAILDVDFRTGGVRSMVPGQVVVGPFDFVNVKLNANSITTGTANLAVVQNKGVQLLQAPSSEWAGRYQLLQDNQGPARASIQTVGAGVGSGGVNKPTGATDGFSLQGIKGMRASTLVNSGAITALQARWWQQVAGIWMPTDNLYQADIPGTANAGWAGPDEVVAVPAQRGYLEYFGVTASGGGTTISPTIELWGSP